MGQKNGRQALASESLRQAIRSIWIGIDRSERRCDAESEKKF
jgi:hypothetical protein